MELVRGGESVSWLWIVDLKMRIGSAIVRVGGIAGLKTKPEYCLKGYASKVMNESIRIMENKGYDISILFGIPDFYHRFGYISLLPGCILEVFTRSVEKSSVPYSVRFFKIDDIGTVLDIYHRENNLRTGSIIRDKKVWQGFPRGTRYSIKAKALVVESRGEVMGYAAYDDSKEEVRVIEIGGINRGVYSILLNKFVSMAIEYRIENIKFYLPLDHPFVYFCRGYGCKFNISFPYNRGGMGRIINLKSAFLKIEQELTRRVSYLNTNKPKFINIITDIGSVAIKVKAHRVNVIPGSLAFPDCTLKLTQEQLMSLIMSYRKVEDVLYTSQVECTKDVLFLLNALFPVGYPYMWFSDRV